MLDETNALVEVLQVMYLYIDAIQHPITTNFIIILYLLYIFITGHDRK